MRKGRIVFQELLKANPVSLTEKVMNSNHLFATQTGGAENGRKPNEWIILTAISDESGNASLVKIS